MEDEINNYVIIYVERSKRIIQGPRMTYPKMGNGVDIERALNQFIWGVQQRPARDHASIIDQQGDLRMLIFQLIVISLEQVLWPKL